MKHHYWIFILPLLSSCSLIVSNQVEATQKYIDQERIIYTIIAEDYLKYIEADSQRSPEAKVAYRAFVNLWQKNLEEMEVIYGAGAERKILRLR
jgi:hypothetical protein